MKKIEKTIHFTYPMYKLKLRVELSAIGKLDSFSHFFLDLLSKVSFTKQDLVSEFDVIHKEFMMNHLDELCFSGHLDDIDDGLLRTSDFGLKSLKDDSIEQNHTCDISLYFDPIIRRFLRIREIKESTLPDRVELLDRPKISELRTRIDADVIRGSIDTTDVDEDFEVTEVLAVKGFSLLENPKLCNIPLTLKCEANLEEENLKISIYNKTLDLSENLSFLLFLENSDRYNIPLGLRKKITEIINIQDKFFESLLNHKEMQSVPEEVKSIVKNSIGPNTSYKVINNIQHSVFLKDIIRLAKKNVFIASGWLNYAFANDSMMRLLSERLKEGIEFHIYYTENKSSDLSAIEKVESYARQFSNLKLHRQPSTWHRKAIIVDDEICVIGSFNWLSNSGRESIETSLMLHDKKIARDLKEAVFLSCDDHSLPKAS